MFSSIPGRIILIETYWNVNSVLPTLYPSVKPILIETYWNVNTGTDGKFSFDGQILIETYWNVNLINALAPAIDFEY